MPRDVSQYDDRCELARYLWHNYLDLFSKSERLAAKMLLAEQKMTSPEMSDTIRRVMQRTWVSRGNRDVDTLLAVGPSQFRISAAMRVVH